MLMRGAAEIPGREHGQLRQERIGEQRRDPLDLGPDAEITGTARRLTFGWETLRALIREPGLLALIGEHFEEIAEDRDKIPLRVQWEHYLRLDEKGILKIWVARDAGEFVGYVCWYVDQHPGSGLLYAWAAPFYLAPEYRRGLTGYHFLTSALPELQNMGVKRVNVHEKVNSPLGILFGRAGFRLYERIHTKVL